ncbi:hypothetical protein RHCRD62_10617 [Rhodococcus sp. RD6.2]|nr:hypothetical protein RHCRD62_10617 [Rhodococcus sp. RD6.2]
MGSHGFWLPLRACVISIRDPRQTERRVPNRHFALVQGLRPANILPARAPVPHITILDHGP